ncbi:nucleoporin NUP42-like isoform X1 [Athene noctua]|uniref:nucleoporin NUP42-like isoform X1 n=2 Tax=Athene noctua TaxID=126797 RepID=UPI003EB87B50
MAICQFFLQGRCRFGERCWNEHPRGGGGRYGPSGSPAPRYQGTSGGGGGWGTTNQRYTNIIQPSAFKSNTWGGSRDHGRGFFGSSGGSSRNADFSQNRFSALMNSQNIADGYKDEEERLLESVVKDMEIWKSSGQWIFSCYSPTKEKPNISGFHDLSPEELRLEYYNCRANNTIQNYVNSVQQLVKQWKNRLVQLKSSNASTKAALLSELKNTVSQPLPSFGFGGQQTSSFGSSSFPVNSSSNSASNFSFKISSSLVNASSGNTPAFGSSSAGCNSAFGVTSSPGVSHSVGFGSLVAPSAGSFSFKASETTNGFGTSAFSGFGSSAAVNTSSATPLTNVAASNAAVAASPSHSSSTLFGQTASASGHNITSASSAVTSNATSGKLFTPMSELSAEELKQFEAKKFTMGKIPLKPPPLELLQI